jgi:hypothetical protein
MNFPDVPFDESLFEAIDMMKSYWERSTENRSDNFVRDVRTEEHDLPEELRQLRQLTLDSFTERVMPELEVVGVPEKASVDALVTEKSVNGYTVVLWIILAAIVVFVVVSQMHHYRYRSSSSHSSSHRRT